MNNTELTIIQALTDQGDLTTEELAEILHCARTSVYRHIENLVKTNQVRQYKFSTGNIGHPLTFFGLPLTEANEE